MVPKKVADRLAAAGSYVVIMPPKRGELVALSQLPDAIAPRVTPLFEVPDVPWDFARSSPKRTLDAHVEKTAADIAKHWSTGATCWIDLTADSTPAASQSPHPLATLFDRFRAAGFVGAVPTTGLDRTAAYQRAVRDIVQRDGRGAVLRLTMEHVEHLAPGRGARSEALLHAVGLTIDETDLVVDVGAISIPQAGSVAFGLGRVLAEAPSLSRWRSVTLAAGGFPPSMAGLGQGITALPRADWHLWQRVTGALHASGARALTYGDYGIQAPGLADLDPRLIRMTANIRYTTTNDWMVARGRAITGKGRVPYDEYRRLARALVAIPAFCGETFSPGDAYLARCARAEVPPGSPEIWRRQGTSHHVAFVVEQLASGRVA